MQKPELNTPRKNRRWVGAEKVRPNAIVIVKKDGEMLYREKTEGQSSYELPKGLRINSIARIIET